MTYVTRRDFIKYSAVLGSLTLLPCSLMAGQATNASSNKGVGNYYLERKQEIVDAFREVLEGAVQFLKPEFGLERTQMITQQALDLFDKLLPEFPDVGGERNWDTKFIPIAAWYVSLYQPMRASGKTAEDVGRLVYELNRIGLQNIPKEKALIEGEKMFSRESLDKMRDWAVWTQKREYPANWVAYFIPGDGKEFDYGYDYTECGLVKYFKSQGTPELAPYVCLNDFPNSAALGSGLRRTKTIGQADGICNFRYKKDRPVIQDWSTEIVLIRSRI